MLLRMTIVALMKRVKIKIPGYEYVKENSLFFIIWKLESLKYFEIE